MLSRKQIWRKLDSRKGSRTVVKHLNSRISANFLSSDDFEHNQKLLIKTLSMKEFKDIINYELTSQESPNKKSKSSESLIKSVKFSSIINVKLIPCRTEMDSLIGILYWTEEDYAKFKQETVKELWKAMKLPDDENISGKQKKKMNILSLLQNTNKIDINEDIFEDNITNNPNNKDKISFDDDNVSEIDVEILNKSVKTMRRVDSVQLLCAHNISLNRQIAV